MYFIYILHSVPSDKFYVGYSEDPYRRLEQHNTKPFNTYTSKHRPWNLKAVFECGNDCSLAMKTERFIKKQKSAVFIRDMMTRTILHSALAHLVKVPKPRD